jgi:hypothetical protein
MIQIVKVTESVVTPVFSKKLTTEQVPLKVVFVVLNGTPKRIMSFARL